MEEKYRVYFFHMGSLRCIDFIGPQNAAHGFWVDRHMLIPETTEDFYIWIPPHKIDYIKRVME